MLGRVLKDFCDLDFDCQSKNGNKQNLVRYQLRELYWAKFLKHLFAIWNVTHAVRTLLPDLFKDKFDTDVCL